jgi:integrase
MNAELVPLGWAYNEGMIPADIGKDFERYSGGAGKRGVLSAEEAAALFERPWADAAAMTANLLAATTGMRKGEILAIRGADIGEAVLNVNHSWSPADGLKSPNNGETRRVPLLPEVRAALMERLAANPYKDVPEGERFVFWGEVADKSRYDGYFMLRALDKEMGAMGLDRLGRNICFHSGRHFYAARMADVEEAEKVSRITGHKSRAVFNAYADHVTEKAVVDLGKTAAAVFAGVLAGAVLAKGRGRD